jgi:pyridoxine/pyridoxamine 5'-phosphate oxidase
MKSCLDVLEFIKKAELAVISTIGPDGRPESAVIGFGETDKFQIIFGTYNSSRKYSNIANDPRVSIVIGWDDGATVQLEGRARALAGPEASRYSNLYFDKSPTASKYASHPEERYFLIEPDWIRYTDLRVEPWDLVEFAPDR